MCSLIDLKMNKKIFLIFIILFVLFGILIVTWSKPGQLNESNKIRVAASFYPLYFFTQQIGGDKADIINITPAGAEPHDYDPTADDIIQIQNSNMLVLNGSGLEP